MTPEEAKAKKLVQHFIDLTNDYGEYRSLSEKVDLAKQCAIICCDEIMDNEVWIFPHKTHKGRFFYEQVKYIIQSI